MAFNVNHVLGLILTIVGIVIILFALGDLLLRFLITLMALSLINYGLRLRGLPPLQLLIPLLISKQRRWF
jgi:hypothetical protein